MAFPRRLLHDTEELVLDLNPHVWFMVAPFVTLLGSVLLGLVVLANEDWASVVNYLALALVLVSLGWFGARYAKWVTTNFVVTTDRLIYRSGVLSKEGIEIPLERVNTVFFQQSLFERMLRAGDLVIESAGEQGRQSFSDVRRPSDVQNEIYRQIEENENRKYDRIGAGSAPMSVAEQLEKLDRLRQNGSLSQEEFEAEKRRLLDRA